jgi:hypothetical protein
MSNKSNFFSEKKGIKIFKENIFNLEYKKANTIFDEDFVCNKYSNNNHPFIKIINSEDALNKKFYLNIYNEIKKRLNSDFFNCLNFEAVWLHKTTKEIYNSDDLPYVPHIDKVRKFKVMIYLNDVDLDCGPLHTLNVDISPEIFEKKRINYREYLDNKVNDYKIENYLPCTGKFGSSIFFDTNIPHFGGKLSEDKFRKILRYNFELN